MGNFSPKSARFEAALWVVSHNSGVKLRWVLVMVVASAAAYVYLQERKSSTKGSAKIAKAIAKDAGVSFDAEGSVHQASVGQPRALEGDPIHVALAYDIQDYYLQPIDEDGGDHDFAPRVQEISRGKAQYDPWLSRAAREIAVQGAILGASPPEAVLSFILRSSGAPEGSVAQMLVQVRGDDPTTIDSAIESALKSAPKGEGTLVLGVGEAAIESGEYDRRVVVVSARRNYSLAPTTRQLEPGETWNIAGEAPRGFRKANASVLYPDNSISVLPVAIHQRQFSIDVPAGHTRGTVWVSIDGIGNKGPGKLLQLQAEVGRALPHTLDVVLPETEAFSAIEDAEDFAFGLLNLDRESQGLATLALDEELSTVARAHSRDMRDNEFFAHQSPTTGLSSDRLKEAEYAATSNGENLAFNDSIAEAQSSLMESVGHRRNIVNPAFTHVGIGLARSSAPSGGDSWHLTQVFARKVQPLDTEQAAHEILAKINDGRVRRGLVELEMREELVALAMQGCEQALREELAEVPSKIAPQASRIMHGRVSVSAHAFYELERLDVGELGGDDEEFRNIGVALLRDPESLQGRTFLVVVVAEPS